MKKLFFIFLAVMMVPNVLLVLSEHQNFWTATCNLLLPLGLYWLAAASSRKLGRTVWFMFPFIFMAAFQIVLTRLFGQSIIGVDMFLNVVTTNMSEINELLGNLIPAVSLVFILYIPMLIMAFVAIRRRRRLDASFVNLQRRLAAASIGLGIVCGIVAHKSQKPMRLIDDIFPVNVSYNLSLAVERYWKTEHYAQTSEGFTFHAKPISNTPRRGAGGLFVLVIGETARAANFGVLGYERNTTPKLSKMQGLTAFGKAYSESNTTHKSVPMLLSAVSSVDFDSIYKQRSIITAFREAGFRTAFFSNQRRNGSFIDFFGEEADVCGFVKEDATGSQDVLDDMLVDYAKREIDSADGPLLVVLHCYGSHFNYRERYPRSFARFTPDDAMEAKRENRQSLLNAYDNTILYTDYMLDRLVSALRTTGKEAVMLYTSDHGEDIYDDGQHFLHASIVPSEFQLHVPLFVWTSQSYAESHAKMVEALKRNSSASVSTSLSLFHTMLQMAGIGTPAFVSSHSLADSLYVSPHRYFINDRNEAVRLMPH
ncbi:MAG: sulfatase-like hydrolase/transferase [Prevotella sp.]